MLIFYFPECFVSCALLGVIIGVKLFTIILKLFKEPLINLSSIIFVIILMLTFVVEVSLGIVWLKWSPLDLILVVRCEINDCWR